MAVAVRSENDLPTIRVLLGTLYDVVFQVVRGRDHPREVARCPLGALGVPDGPPGTWTVTDEGFALPADVRDALAAATEDLGSSADPSGTLWLELPSPRGYAYLLPWERMLAPLGRPVLRLPNHTVRPQGANDLQVAVCVGSARGRSLDPAEVAAGLASVWLDEVGQHRPTVHLFTDAATYNGTRAAVEHLGESVVVHEPRGIEAGHARSNPWLRWVWHAREGLALDVLHLYGSGVVSGDRGGMTLGSPAGPSADGDADQRPTTIVGSAELTTFLARSGAWSAVLTGAPGNQSGAGLRAVADDVAQVRPGVAMVHSADDDPGGDQLRASVRMVFGGGELATRPMPGVTCWVHPGFVDYPEEQRADLLLTEDGRSTLLADPVRAALDAEATPAWIAAASRSLEAQQAAWLPGDVGEQVDPDAVAALRAVSELVAKHVVEATEPSAVR